MKRKISLMCDVDDEAVVAATDAPSIYDIPKVLHAEGLDAYVVRRLDLPFRDVDWTSWNDLLDRVHHPKEEVTIALVGKYIDLPDAYLSVERGAAGRRLRQPRGSNMRWVASDSAQRPRGRPGCSATSTGSCIPGGFGVRGIEGKVGAIRYARENRIPILGLCLGLQCMVIEVARNLAGLEGANSSEFDPEAAHPVIATMAEQEDIVSGDGDLGGTMRLGSYPAELCRARSWPSVYGRPRWQERHRHRYEVNNALPDKLEDGRTGVLRHVAGRALVEFIELDRTRCTRTSSPPRRTRS